MTDRNNAFLAGRLTSLEEAKRLAASGGCRRVPVYKELLADLRTPLEVLRALQEVSDHCFLLESAEEARQWGRYTFLGYDPSLEVSLADGVLTLRAGSGDVPIPLPEGAARDGRILRAGESVSFHVDHPGQMIEKLIRDNRAPAVEGLPPFSGGLVGYFAYDYFQYAEPSLRFKAEDAHGFRDMDLMLFDKIIAFDNLRQRILLIANIRTENLEASYIRGAEDIGQMEKSILRGASGPIPGGRLLSPVRPLFSQEEYSRKVEAVKRHIHEGDIFQLVLSNPMEADFEGSLLNAYRILRTTNPSPYMFYFSGDVEIAGASPETLVKVTCLGGEGKNTAAAKSMAGGAEPLPDAETGGHGPAREIRTFPLAGTRPRGRDYAEDLRLERELLADEKERAEHNMLVDLGRNDLGKVCAFGTVQVEKYMAVERYSHVMHIGSEVKGLLRDDASVMDAVDAVLPAGTLSGAPKIRACQLIDGLEEKKRGLYGGAIGYMDFAGNLDLCIAIRLAFARDGKVFVRSGAGIVADSVPASEYRECINKAKAVVQALEAADA